MFHSLLEQGKRGLLRALAYFAWRPLPLYFFEDVLEVEFRAINRRRNGRRPDISSRGPSPAADSKDASVQSAAPGAHRRQAPSPDPKTVFLRASEPAAEAVPSRALEATPVDSSAVNYFKMHPRPAPCDANGLAFSGGGIRSAAICLGALQAIQAHRVLRSIDYLSTVSGGGYIGACLSAAMRRGEGVTAANEDEAFPFGEDVWDSEAVAHLRNYSNYLMPCGRSNIRNAAEAAAILLRGLLANVAILVTVLLGFAIVTHFAYPDFDSLQKGSFLPRLLDAVLHSANVNQFIGASPFRLTLWMGLFLLAILFIWALLRSRTRLNRLTDDTHSVALLAAFYGVIATVSVAFLDLQPLAIDFLIHVHHYLDKHNALSTIKLPVAAVGAFSGAVSALSGALGNFLKSSEHATDWTTFALRIATKLMVFLAALVLPLAIWIAYLELSLLFASTNDFMISCAWPDGQFAADWPRLASILRFCVAALPKFMTPCMWPSYLLVFIFMFFATAGLRSNNYSLHRFFRDRLSQAFLLPFPLTTKPADQKDARTHSDNLKLSGLRNSSGPYHIINAALNVEGSKEANKRGRNAEFFMFTPDFVGSDLTRYAHTEQPPPKSSGQKPEGPPPTDMEALDPRLDLATAVAISGAAVSANMGTYTVRLLSPTLALLNIRLGYWLRNPRDYARKPNLRAEIRGWTSFLFAPFYLFQEMFNLLDETSPSLYLTDGGNIENLGVYELLKRGCQLIVVVDAEADPSMSFPSLLTLERYARIDLGVRIVLPWEAVAAMTKSVDAQADGARVCSKGPHCAIGKIIYATGAEGILIYFKSSLTGDEKDYVLDYKKRYPSFPHESTGDQFFSEEQFEVYRALGYHMVDGLFGGSDSFSFLSSGPDSFVDRAAAIAEVRAMLGPGALKWVAH